MPRKIIIVAMTADRVIGRDGQLPWRLPGDLKLFKAATFGNTVVMGRRTFESIGKPLANRNNIVISSRPLPDPGVTRCPDFERALAEALRLGRDIFFIGGAEVYRRALAVADELRVSWVKGAHRGDTFFPEFDPAQWRQVSRQEHTEFDHTVYQRKR